MPVFSIHTEKELLQLISRGSEQAFTHLYNQYQPLVSTHLFRITRSRILTDEITQDIFTKIWTGRDKLAVVDCFKAYLAVVTRNHALNALRQLSTQKFRQLQYQQHFFPAHEVEDDHKEILAALDKAIDQLPPQQKKTWILARHQRMKYGEIADQLQLTRGTVKRYLQIATESISKQLGKNAAKDALKTILLIFLMRF